MGPAARVRVLTDTADPEAVRAGRLLDGAVIVSGVALVRARPDLVVVRGGPELLRHATWLTTMAGARAVLAVPTGQARPLPWWERRFQRFVLRSQAEARAWAEAGIALGRLVVVAPGSDAEERAAWSAVVEEALSMARRPAARRAAR